jgi:hypothetical protein
MFKKISIMLLLLCVFFGSLAPVARADDLKDALKDIEYCYDKPYNRNDIADFYADRLRSLKEKGSLDLYINFYSSDCFNTYKRESKYKEIGEKIEKIRKAEEKAGFNRVDGSSIDKREIETEYLLSNFTNLGNSRFIFSGLDGIADLTSSIPNPFGSMDVKTFNLNDFLADIFVPIRTPKFMKDKNVNIDQFINITILIFVAVIVIRFGFLLLEIQKAETSEQVKYKMLDHLKHNIALPFLWFIFGIKFVGLILIIVVNILTPLMMGSTTGAVSMYDCKNQFANADGKGLVKYKDGICAYYAFDKNICLNENKTSCKIKNGFINSFFDRMSMVSVNHLKNVPWVNGVSAMSTLYALLAIPMLLIVLLIIMYHYFQLVKMTYDIFLDGMFGYIYTLDKNALDSYLTELKSHVFGFMVKSVLISLTMSLLIPLLTTNWINELPLILVVLAIPFASNQIASKLGLVSQNVATGFEGLGIAKTQYRRHSPRVKSGAKSIYGHVTNKETFVGSKAHWAKDKIGGGLNFIKSKFKK